MENLIQSLIVDELTPSYLEVVDESHMHSVPDGAQSHFKVTVVSDKFEGQKLIQRHRQLNQLLKPAFERSLHALAMHTMTPEEWEKKGGKTPDSPDCHGGSKST